MITYNVGYFPKGEILVSGPVLGQENSKSLTHQLDGDDAMGANESCVRARKDTPQPFSTARLPRVRVGDSGDGPSSWRMPASPHPRDIECAVRDSIASSAESSNGASIYAYASGRHRSFALNPRSLHLEVDDAASSSHSSPTARVTGAVPVPHTNASAAAIIGGAEARGRRESDGSAIGSGSGSASASCSPCAGSHTHRLPRADGNRADEEELEYEYEYYESPLFVLMAKRDEEGEDGSPQSADGDEDEYDDGMVAVRVSRTPNGNDRGGRTLDERIVKPPANSSPLARVAAASASSSELNGSPTPGADEPDPSPAITRTGRASSVVSEPPALRMKRLERLSQVQGTARRSCRHSPSWIRRRRSSFDATTEHAPGSGSDSESDHTVSSLSHSVEQPDPADWQHDPY